MKVTGNSTEEKNIIQSTSEEKIKTISEKSEEEKTSPNLPEEGKISLNLSEAELLSTDLSGENTTGTQNDISEIGNTADAQNAISETENPAGAQGVISETENIPDTKKPQADMSEVLNTGKLPYTMKNDYLFKAVFQENKAALKELLAVLLHRKPEELSDVRLENPIILGETVDDKTVILDILVTLNDHERVNIEMQVLRQDYWEERTLVYLCRNFVTLNKGATYDNVKPTVHIGILDFAFKTVGKEFYAENVFMNRKTHQVYSDKLSLNMLSLKNIKNATEEDKASGLYEWAEFFAANTWEELKMAAKAMKSEAMQSAVVTIRDLTAQERIRLQCEARERYQLSQLTRESLLKKAEEGKKKAEEGKKKAEEKAQKAEERAEKAEARIRELEAQLSAK